MYMKCIRWHLMCDSFTRLYLHHALYHGAHFIRSTIMVMGYHYNLATTSTKLLYTTTIS
jgi:hypothetical protein